jgi:hypothetical protein
VASGAGNQDAVTLFAAQAAVAKERAPHEEGGGALRGRSLFELGEQVAASLLES